MPKYLLATVPGSATVLVMHLMTFCICWVLSGLVGGLVQYCGSSLRRRLPGGANGPPTGRSHGPNHS